MPILQASIAIGWSASHILAPYARSSSMRSLPSATMLMNELEVSATLVIVFPKTIPNVGMKCSEAYHGVDLMANRLPSTVTKMLLTETQNSNIGTINLCTNLDLPKYISPTASKICPALIQETSSRSLVARIGRRILASIVSWAMHRNAPTEISQCNLSPKNNDKSMLDDSRESDIRTLEKSYLKNMVPMVVLS